MQRASVVAVLLLASCQTAVEVPPGTSDPAKFEPAVLSAAETVSVVATIQPGAVSLGKVQSHACQRFQWEPDPSEEAALTLLKAEAAKRGANVLTNISFRRANISVANNCYGTRFAEGDAYRLP